MTVLNVGANPGGVGRGSANHVRKSLTFTGAAGFGLAADVITIFTVTGVVILRNLLVVCTDTLTQNLATPTLALGVSNLPTFFIAATTATGLTSTNNIWQDTTPSPVAEAMPAGFKDIALATNIAALAIIATVGGTNNINGGTLVFDAWYDAVTDGANLA